MFHLVCGGKRESGAAEVKVYWIVFVLDIKFDTILDILAFATDLPPEGLDCSVLSFLEVNKAKALRTRSRKFL